jgi:hypothetical protein
MTSDIYSARGDDITDALLGDPDLFTPVSQEFADASDPGYGEWSEPGGEEDLDGEAGPDADGADGGGGGAAEDRFNRELSDDEQADLAELDQMMRGSHEPLLAATGRGAYVHPGDPDDAAPEGEAGVTGTSVMPPTTSPTPPPGGRRWGVDLSRRGHRIGAFAAVGGVIAVIASLAFPWGGKDAPPTDPAAGSPNFSLPTVTETPASPSPTAAAGVDGPIGIKRVDSRCTAGSTDPKQAFDSDLNTAWMCVPAYGVPGTVLRVEFDNWYVVSGVSIVPGWNRVNPDGSDEWIKHKTAAKVEYQFNDPEETRLAQQTNSIRDEVFTAVQPPVLASAMTITITEFGTPTGAVANTTSLPGQGGIIASDVPVTGDLKDFAISSISVLGRRPA